MYEQQHTSEKEKLMNKNMKMKKRIDEQLHSSGKKIDEQQRPSEKGTDEQKQLSEQ